MSVNSEYQKLYIDYILIIIVSIMNLLQLLGAKSLTYSLRPIVQQCPTLAIMGAAFNGLTVSDNVIFLSQPNSTSTRVGSDKVISQTTTTTHHPQPSQTFKALPDNPGG